MAFDPGGWTPERRAKVADLFNSLAPEWDGRIKPGRHLPLADALTRGLGGARTDGPCLEIGSGTGDSTPLIAKHYDRVVSIDLAAEMLALAPAGAVRVQADSALLPVTAGRADAVVLVNALLFPAEVDRVLAPEGRLVWVNTSGDQTPIHLSAQDVIAALTGTWHATASEAGNGTWCLGNLSHLVPPHGTICDKFGSGGRACGGMWRLRYESARCWLNRLGRVGCPYLDPQRRARQGTGDADGSPGPP